MLFRSNEQWTIFPNPSNGIFKLQMNPQHSGSVDNYQISIFNLVGEKVYSIVNTKMVTQNSLLSVDLSAQSKGVYFLQIIYENKSVVNKKIIIQ